MCHILPRVSMANEGIRIGNWIYWPLTGRNYN
jgi:hypothetical protein